MKLWVLLGALGIAGTALVTTGAVQDPVILGIAQTEVRTEVDGTVKLRTTSLGGIRPTFQMRNTQVAQVDSVGVVKGLQPGITYVRARYFDGRCLKNDSARVVVLRKASKAGFLSAPLGVDVRALFSPRPTYKTNADRVMASSMFVVAGITPKTGAQAAIGTTFQFTVTSVAPVSATVLSRNTAVATVTNGGLATGVGEGDTWIVATVFNGNCTVKDSARITVIDTTTLGEIEGDSTRGRLAWKASCQSCHMADKAYDLELFNFNSVIRRARVHVDTLTALDILAHVATLGAGGPLDSLTQIYQPGTPATKVASDSMFSVTLTGADSFPARWTRDTLLAQNIRNVRIPIDFPRWSNEVTRYDWVPGQGGVVQGPIPAGVLAAGIIQNKLATWRANPTMTNAVSLATSLINVAHQAAIPDAPCTYETAPARWAGAAGDSMAQKCFDVAKWASGLCYLTGIQNGISADSILKRCEATWWETGHMIHKCQQHNKNCELRSEQITAWIYLGSLQTWAAGGGGLAGQGEALLYFSGPAGISTAGLGYGRWVTWMGAQMLTRRPATTKGGQEACRDVHEIAETGHAGHILNAMTYAFNEMLHRLDNSKQLAATKSVCTNNSTSTSGSNAGFLGTAMTEVNTRAGSTVFNQLKPLADSVRARINAL